MTNSLSGATGAVRRDTRLYPSVFNGRFYVLTLLRRQLTSVIDACLSHQKGLVLLDFGCGGKPYAPLFAGPVTSHLGVDLPGNSQVDICMSPDGKIPLPDESVDVVLSTQVLEHVDNPALYLSESYRVLKRGGLLILSTHGYWLYHADPQDFWRWTHEGLKKTITHAGFAIKRWHGIVGMAAASAQLFQDAITGVVPKFARGIFFMVMQLFILALDNVYSGADRGSEACVFLAVAEKR
jgi:SAM-dependent methyltransferase